MLRRIGRQEGFSLVEVLMGMAITAMIGATLTSVLLTIATNSRRDLRQTDQYESLRLAAHRIVEDGRHAYAAEALGMGSQLKLYTDQTFTNYILYAFTTCDGTPDAENLHRQVWEGGSCTDDAVASNLVPPELWNPNATEFGAESGAATRYARATLVKPPLKGQAVPTRIQTYVLLR